MNIDGNGYVFETREFDSDVVTEHPNPEWRDFSPIKCGKFEHRLYMSL